jgi:hypothetical protein
MDFINLIFAIAALVMLCRMIQLSNRITVACETSAIIVSNFYALMTPEARAKADQYLKDLKDLKAK